ncbi:uncharacterized protein LOC126819644 [Patella vulgata]|uniref:uncharacterized protein LOC126819644 n=1 Tax=Patella vulgata TaxID=6465 RepID=UPI00217F7B75|nr:uncharacterized protein LOC126819644 [Patella vulgata]
MDGILVVSVLMTILHSRVQATLNDTIELSFSSLSHRNKRYNSDPFNIFKNVGVLHCAKYCLQRSMCQSFGQEGDVCSLFETQLVNQLETNAGSLFSTKSEIEHFFSQNELNVCGNVTCPIGTICIQTINHNTACVFTDCPNLPEKPRNSYLPPIVTREVGKSLLLQCDFRPVGNASITCQTDGNWTIPNFNCIDECVSPPTSSSMTNDANATAIGTIITYTCNLPSFGNTSIICRGNATWSELDEDVCYYECVSPPTSSSMTNDANATAIGTIITYTCNLPSFGNTSIICRGNATWSELDEDVCYYECVSPPTSSSMTNDANATAIGTIITYTCNLPRFGNTSIICRGNATWSELDEDVCYYGKNCFDTMLLGGNITSNIIIAPRPNSQVEVTCKEEGGLTYTIIPHDLQPDMILNGTTEVTLVYTITQDTTESIISQSQTCRQYVEYRCFNSSIHVNGVLKAAFYTRHHNRADYFPGGTPGEGNCACGVNKVCNGTSPLCNCDSNDEIWRIDDGYVRNKGDLPITKFEFDLEAKVSYVTIDGLECEGSV